MQLIISDEEKKALLACARETISAELEQRQSSYNRIDELRQKENSALNKKYGAFVTLSKGQDAHNLRGCIGLMNASYPLADTVKKMAFEAAFGDSRFPPLTEAELPLCKIEISVLSPMEICSDPERVIVGTHGLYLVYKGRAGVFLPQVPVEQGWKRQEYLDYVCVKAGLPQKSYAAPGAQLYTFTALVFKEA
ncbi:MAG: AmmeMemoRadiSam system protein A [Spirochaetaceae bacterium]|jgi:AmmeMemoRadiSam system protein A|nr:AmmeMemoRadiSam system protein A [Spirochaetaceae bacterium]